MSTAAGIAVLALLGLLGLVYFRQERLIFFPEPLAPDFRPALPDVEEVAIAVDGARLSALHLRLPRPKGVVFFLHGNAGNLSQWFDAPFYRDANFDLFVIDYRGYGRSSGRISSEAQLHADVQAAWESIEPRYRGLRKVIYGRSLGTGLAARLAASVKPDLVILVSPYWSLAELARLHYPLLPRFLLRYPLMTYQDIGLIDAPILLIHGDRDTLIPCEHSERLRALAHHATLVLIPGAAHNDLQDSDQYTRAIVDALSAIPRKD